SASDLFVRARMTSKQGKLDFRKNYDSGSEGWGLAVGIDAREVKARRDQTDIAYVNNSSPLGDIGFVPEGFRPWLYDLPVLWIDYDRFEHEVKPGLAVNET